jgi:hypothetical protein
MHRNRKKLEVNLVTAHFDHQTALDALTEQMPEVQYRVPRGETDSEPKTLVYQVGAG